MACIEGDFFGDNFSFRLRHAYGEYAGHHDAAGAGRGPLGPAGRITGRGTSSGPTARARRRAAGP
jgi:hypothetical protein